MLLLLYFPNVLTLHLPVHNLQPVLLIHLKDTSLGMAALHDQKKKKKTMFQFSGLDLRS